MDFKQQMLDERLRMYAKLAGGYTFPLAGAIWWAAAAGLGYYVTSIKTWSLYAFIGSGMIFPLALLLSNILRVNFMTEKSAVDTVLGPAFVGMLLFWPSAFAAYMIEPALCPLILAIGMAAHWPVIGWTYGRSALYSAHAIVRALAVMAIWVLYPEQRTTWLPASVSIVYFITVIAILIDVRVVRARQAVRAASAA